MCTGDESCGKCRDCCSCARGWDLYRPPDVPFTIGKNKLNRSRRFISAEIEVNSCGRGTGFMKAIHKWGAAVVRDGSVPEGFEINTSPASGDSYYEQIKEITDALNKQRSEVGGNCGLHVHVDARDFNFYDMRRLVILYRGVEMGLFGIVHVSRYNGQYSRVCGEKYYNAIKTAKVPKEFKSKFLTNIYGQTGISTSRRELARQKYHGSRYNAMNLHSWMYRGTIENRMFQGTTQFDDIYNWGFLNASILDFAMNRTERDILDMLGMHESSQPDSDKAFKSLLKIAPEIEGWLRKSREAHLVNAGSKQF